MTFHADNTSGYDATQLAELNRRYIAKIATYSPEDQAEKSVQDHIAERVLAEFDSRVSPDAPQTPFDKEFDRKGFARPAEDYE